MSSLERESIKQLFRTKFQSTVDTSIVNFARSSYIYRKNKRKFDRQFQIFYPMKRAVRTLGDIQRFAKELIKESVAFHSDTDFYSYVDIHTGERTYSDDEAETRNKLMADSFYVCELLGVDIYEFMIDINIRETQFFRSLIPRS